MSWINGLFSGGFDIARVNPIGLIVMAIGVLLNVFSGYISGKIQRADRNGVRLLGLVICAGGAMLAILG